jgi:hypothetical protein
LFKTCFTDQRALGLCLTISVKQGFAPGSNLAAKGRKQGQSAIGTSNSMNDSREVMKNEYPVTECPVDMGGGWPVWG